MTIKKFYCTYSKRLNENVFFFSELFKIFLLLVKNFFFTLDSRKFDQTLTFMTVVKTDVNKPTFCTVDVKPFTGICYFYSF